ncbi:hypothetical protein Cde04nite_09990 [Cellulomonas denverensis]|nr:hypothetical protein Cde04nite_09990 [Cellulomonas denverensis]
MIAECASTHNAALPLTACNAPRAKPRPHVVAAKARKFDPFCEVPTIRNSGRCQAIQIRDTTAVAGTNGSRSCIAGCR